MMRLNASASFEFSMELGILEEADKIDIAAVVDAWLDDFTSDCSRRREYTQNRVFTEPDDVDCSFGLETMLKEGMWEQWNEGLEERCLQWLAVPSNLSRLESGISAEVSMVTKAFEASGDTPSYPQSTLWQELSFRARQAIGMKASEDKIGSPERERIREDLICLHTRLTQEFRSRMDEYIKSSPEKNVVLIERRSKTVCAQGVDLPDAIQRLSAFRLPGCLMEPTPRNTAGDCVFDVYLVPECMNFGREDAHLVERWGDYERSLINAAPKAA
jgi:hypothetical protein